ncbi:ATP-dependent DNA helicase PIF1 [Paramuricea clavata]|uniref:ATP-dependent DNA helicase n=1 Tax=Paramuricea clavata TaxID=317549 RepID=A0A7D9EMF6_PARCT|nr:ATP-dependent DNA helicase PIF1 [Paramuricea clavata]
MEGGNNDNEQLDGCNQEEGEGGSRGPRRGRGYTIQGLSCLTSDQERLCEIALEGHNICITGKAGTGKSVLVGCIQRELKRRGKTVAVICSSGLSCEVYQGAKAKTVHSQYGLQIAELPYDKLVKRSLAKNNVVDHVKSVDVVIWDEVSMSSQRILEIVSRIHHIVLASYKPLGGVQFILVGDFWQLSPIASAVDAGLFAFLATIFNIAFPHRFELTNIIRQDNSQKSLRVALEGLRYGKCTDESELHIQSLENTILCEGTLHLFFKRLPVEIHNFNVLLGIPGRMFSLHAQDQGHVTTLDFTVGKTIHLKEGCNVLLLYNISEDLRNGTTGKLVKVEEDSLTVAFPKVGHKQIVRKIWYVHDRNGKVLGSRTQFPIVPSYAVTVHKSQGMTLDSAVVHCTREFVPGQTYVAVSRMKKDDDLQVIGFRKSFLLPIPDELVSFDSTYCAPFLENQKCCKNQVLDGNAFLVHDREEATLTDPEDPANTISHFQESAAKAYYEDFEDAEPASLEDVLLSLDEMTSELSAPPKSFNPVNFLETFIFKHDDPVSSSINSEVEFALDESNVDNFKLLLGIIWCRIFIIFKDFLAENVDSVRMTSKNFFDATAKLNGIFLSCEYRRDVCAAFGETCWQDISHGQQALCAQIVHGLFQLFINEVAQRIRRVELSEPVPFRVEEMDDIGKGKIRYIGGWVVRKVLETSRRYLKDNKFSTVTPVRARLAAELRKMEMLENDIIVPFESLENDTEAIGTLNVVESRQFRCRGLLHISDAAHAFFLLLEQQRVDQINQYHLLHEQGRMVEAALIKIGGDEDLKDKFRLLFNMENAGDEVGIDNNFTS